nr:uncharacterized protein LOC110150522 isoform X2 [Odocoileus virginianus texanus]
MNGWTPSGTGSQTTWGGNPRPEKGKDLPRVPHRPVQPPHWSLCLLMLRSTQLDPRSGPVQIPSWCSGLPAHRAGPRSLGSGAAALAPGASSRLSQRDRGCEGSGAFSRDAGLAPRHPPTTLPQSILFASFPEMPVTIVLAESCPVCSLANVFMAEDQSHGRGPASCLEDQTDVCLHPRGARWPAGHPNWRWK